jgi:Putative peptidoglycan binding domain
MNGLSGQLLSNSITWLGRLSQIGHASGLFVARFATNIIGFKTGAIMPGDGAAGLWNKASWNKVWPRRAGESEAANDPLFTEVVSDFSRRLRERAADQSATDAAAAARQRRAALMAYDREHRRRLILVGGFGVGALMGLALAMIAPPVAAPPLAPTAAAGQPESATASAAVPSAPAATVTSPAPEPPPPVVKAETVEMPPPKAEPVEAAKPPEPVHSAAVAPLRADEILELQTKLRGFGFNPGPSDGVAGYMTTAAVARYQQNRGLPETGKIDREVLDQVRQDPAPQVAPQVAHRPPRHPVRAGTATARRSPDPFQRFGQWLDSLVR